MVAHCPNVNVLHSVIIFTVLSAFSYFSVFKPLTSVWISVSTSTFAILLTFLWWLPYYYSKMAVITKMIMKQQIRKKNCLCLCTFNVFYMCNESSYTRVHAKKYTFNYFNKGSFLLIYNKQQWTCSSEETASWSSAINFETWSTGRLRNSSESTTSL